MKLRLLALALAAIAALPAAKATTFAEVVNASAVGVTTTSNQVLGGNVDFVVGRLRLNVEAGQHAFVTYTFLGAESADAMRFYGPAGASMLDTRANVGTLLTTAVSGGLLDFGFVGADGLGSTGNGTNSAWNASNVGIVLADGGVRGGCCSRTAVARAEGIWITTTWSCSSASVCRRCRNRGPTR
jgi:hypothetical protein